MKIRSLILYPDGTLLQQDVSFGDIALAVGGLVEVVYGDYGFPVVAACVNEEGLLKQLPVNRYATSVVRRMKDMWPGIVLVGPCVFVGAGDEEFADLDEDSAQFIIETVNALKKAFENTQGKES